MTVVIFLLDCYHHGPSVEIIQTDGRRRSQGQWAGLPLRFIDTGSPTMNHAVTLLMDRRLLRGAAVSMQFNALNDH